VRIEGQDALQIVPGTSLGLARLREAPGKDVAASFSTLPPEVRAYARRPELLVITKSTSRSTVHRPGYLDYIGVKRFDAMGRLVGEIRIVGLFTSTAYTRAARSIPYLRKKLAALEQRFGLDPNSHSGKALANVLEQYPRDFKGQDHYHDWVNAVLEGRKACDDFAHGGPLTETVLVGAMADRFAGEWLAWDQKALTFPQHKTATALVRRSYRKGWSVPGLG
jgi:hypothetical protein